MRYDVLGLMIKTRRKEMKLTQEDLADKVGISASFMGAHRERISSAVC